MKKTSKNTHNSLIHLCVYGLVWILLWCACRISAKTLPSEALEVRHRIQVVAIDDQRDVKFAEEFAREYSRQFGMRAYIIHKEAWYKVLLGDFSSPKKTNAALKAIKRVVKDAWPAAPDNDKIISIWENGRPLDFQKGTLPPASTLTATPLPAPTPTLIPSPTPIPTPILLPSPTSTRPELQVVTPRRSEKDAKPNPKQQHSHVSSPAIIKERKTQDAEHQFSSVETSGSDRENVLPYAGRTTYAQPVLSLPEAPEMLANLSVSHNMTPTPLPDVKEVDLLTAAEKPETRLRTPFPEQFSESPVKNMPSISPFHQKEAVAVSSDDVPVNVDDVTVPEPTEPSSIREERLAVESGTVASSGSATGTPAVRPISAEPEPTASPVDTSPISEERVESSWQPSTGPSSSISIVDLNLDAVLGSPHAELTEELPIMVVSPDGEFFLTSSHEKALLLWDKKSGTKLKTFVGHRYPIVSASFSPDGKHIISASRLGQDDPLGEIRLWERESGEEISSFRKDLPMVDLVGFSDDGQYAYHDASGERVWWDLKTGERVQR
ncbi:hypothetical protein CSA56_00870 [candidate division KSB3 bacterium]|uniref:SPOR domain-containing protein n=1 Tax=candidate division KSB3 bacterium TaxID=2044937 RepID=A0A2G6KMK1_9BACT|nr:MAG: hypothetical protein CSA56_00870 [candidate division KSB3 bacterium]